MDRKPRADSKLKTLPEERQAAIAEYCRGHSLPEVVQWLKDDGVQTSAAAVSTWLSWWTLREQLARNESTVETVLGELKRNHPSLTEGELFAAGQSFFAALAIEQRDALAWKRTQDVKVKREALELEERKFQVATCELFLKWWADRRAADVVESKASNAEKIERLRQMMFADVMSHDGPPALAPVASGSEPDGLANSKSQIADSK